MKPALVLACQICGHRPAADSTVEAFKLHCQVEHDTDDVKFDLIAVCRCDGNPRMTLERTDRLPDGRVDDWYRCPTCDATGNVRRKP